MTPEQIKQWIDLVKAVSEAIWPLIVLVFSIVFVGPLSGLLSSFRGRNLKIKIGDTEIEIGDYIRQQNQLISDIQNKLAGTASLSPDGVQGKSPGGRVSRILWVDDNPSNNAFLEERFVTMGIRIDKALSTDEGLRSARTTKYDLVISDMGRNEHGKRVYDAGLKLLQAMREEKNLVPVVIYTTLNNVTKFRKDVQELHGQVTSSPTDVVSLVLKQNSEND